MWADFSGPRICDYYSPLPWQYLGTIFFLSRKPDKIKCKLLSLPGLYWCIIRKITTVYSARSRIGHLWAVMWFIMFCIFIAVRTYVLLLHVNFFICLEQIYKVQLPKSKRISGKSHLLIPVPQLPIFLLHHQALFLIS